MTDLKVVMIPRIGFTIERSKLFVEKNPTSGSCTGYVFLNVMNAWMLRKQHPALGRAALGFGGADGEHTNGSLNEHRELFHGSYPLFVVCALFVNGHVTARICHLAYNHGRPRFNLHFRVDPHFEYAPVTKNNTIQRLQICQ